MIIPTNCTQPVACLLVFLDSSAVLLSSILISSYPSGASVFANGEFIGETPVRHRDAEPSGSLLDVRIEKDGYEDFDCGCRKKGRVNFRALMFCWLLFPLAWLEKYPPSFYGHLNPVSEDYSPLRVQVQTREALGSNIFVDTPQYAVSWVIKQHSSRKPPLAFD